LALLFSAIPYPIGAQFFGSELLRIAITALMFQFVNNVDPGSVNASVGEATNIVERYDQFAEFMYFSFITLTSVGYGDLTPI